MLIPSLARFRLLGQLWPGRELSQREKTRRQPLPPLKNHAKILVTGLS